jgi:hypothetical protein
MTFLGVPKDENDWLKYEGHCKIFCGETHIVEDDEDNEYDDNGDDNEQLYNWILESTDITKNKIIAGLQTVGVRCENIQFTKEDSFYGTRMCTCICYYNKPYEIYNSDFFIEGLTEFSFMRSHPGRLLEFWFKKRINYYK